MKFLCDQCKAKYQIADEKAAGKTVRMKCRKCGHLIEVRAAVTETSVSSAPPAGGQARVTPSPGQPAPPPRAAQKPAAPRAAPLATSLAAAKPAVREKSGALAGAFKSNVQRDEEISSPIDMSDLSPSDEWYVAINGVPVGPIRIAEIRRKAALGGVTEDSLAWQEGLDEWRPVRSFPELAAIVREAFASGRASLTPAPPGRSSIPPPPRAPPARPASPSPPPRAPAGPARTPLAQPTSAAFARSNVVPITSRLATAERLEPVAAAVVPDPFASPPAAPSPAVVPSSGPDRMAMASPVSLAAPIPLATDMRGRRQPPWVAIGMVAAFVAFGITAGVMVMVRPQPQPPPVVVQMPGVPAATVPTSTAATPSATDSPQAPAAAPPTKVALGSGGPSRPAAQGTAAAAPAAAAPRGPLDLHSLTQGQTNVAPTDEPGGDAPKAPGQCFSSGQVQQVVSLHKSAVQRTCWERNPSNRLAANVSVTLTVDPDGSVQNVSASGEEPSVAKCVEGEVRGWHFPAMGCSQAMNIPFHFVRQ